MKNIVLFAFVVLPFVGFGQRKGIQFSKFKNWREVVSEAQKSDKMIFVDAYATWCGPCKQMDEEVFNVDSVGAITNKNFISVKIQFDKTIHDNEYIKGWYTDAELLKEKYVVDAFPTFLFFSKGGKLVAREVGFQPVQIFINTVASVIDPQRNLDSLVAQFNNGKLPNQEMLNVALLAKRVRQDSVALLIARSYKENVIDKAYPEDILNSELHEFISNFYMLFSVDDPIAEYLYRNANKSDSLMQNIYSMAFVEYLIYQRYVLPVVMNGGKYISTSPNWKYMEKRVKRRFDKAVAKKITLTTMVSFYKYWQDWEKAIDYSIALTDFKGLDTTEMGCVEMNNLVYDLIFSHSTNMRQLNRALAYMQLLLNKDKNNYFWLDTYANVLYKKGDRDKAIRIEERALSLARNKGDDESIHSFKITVDKMYKGEPTWNQ